MLDTLDVLIGFTVIMLILSMPVTMFTQFTINFFNLRGVALLQGVASLLVLLDARLSGTAPATAKRLLTNQLVATRTAIRGRLLAAGTVHREELAKLILHDAVPGAAALAAARHAAAQADSALAAVQAAAIPGAGQLETARAAAEAAHRALDRASTTADTALAAVLHDLGISDPEQTLKDVRTTQLALERSNPELANDVRASIAMLDHASSDFLAKFNGWFDPSMDRVSELFTSYTRVATAAIALVLALFLQVDAVSLINRLSTDGKARDALVEAAVAHPERFKTADDAVPPNAGEVLKRFENDPGLADMTNLKLVEIPRSPADWASRWARTDSSGRPLWLGQLFGILLTAALLSLGGPFWYALLGNLIKLRPVLAKKDEEQREIRQTTQTTVVESKRAAAVARATAPAAGP